MVSKRICLFIHIFVGFIIIFNISARLFHFIKWKKNNKKKIIITTFHFIKWKKDKKKTSLQIINIFKLDFLLIICYIIYRGPNEIS